MIVNGHAEKPPQAAKTAMRSIASWLIASSVALMAIACADNQKSPTTRPLTMEQRQQQLIADPFGYKTDTPNTDISGGDLTQFDKDAFKKDVDHVFNP